MHIGIRFYGIVDTVSANDGDIRFRFGDQDDPIDMDRKLGAHQ